MSRPPVKAPLKTWWAKKWAEAFQAQPPEPKVRGRQRPRSAKLRNLDPVTGEATVEVSTSSVLPYEVRIAVTPISDEVWAGAVQRLAGRALFAAKLLAGDLPPETDDAFVAAGASLFPGPKDVKVRCNCPSGSGGCRHGALAQRCIAEAIDRDPFLLFDLRGRPRAQVLTALGVSGPGTSPAPASAPADAPAEAAPEVVDPAMFRRVRGDLVSMHFHIAPPERERLLLTRLGDPPGWRGPPSFQDALGPAVTAAAGKAREIAMGDDVPQGGNQIG